MANTCLVHASQRALVHASSTCEGDPSDSLVVSGQNFDLATLRPVLPPELELGGVYQLSGSLFDLMGDPRGAVALDRRHHARASRIRRRAGIRDASSTSCRPA